MINARQANFESKNLKKVSEIEDEIAKGIQNAIENGNFTCDVNIQLDTSKEVRSRIRDDLQKLGYDVLISDNKESERGCPVDQCSYYDVIRISWED